jgi:hypothetical protein
MVRLRRSIWRDHIRGALWRKGRRLCHLSPRTFLGCVNVRTSLPIAVCWASGPKPYVQRTREGPAHHGLVSCPRPRGPISETSTWRWHGGSGSDSALRFGRAALQHHPHQQTFATTIRSTRADAVDSDRFRFLGKIAEERVSVLARTRQHHARLANAAVTFSPAAASLSALYSSKSPG